MQSMALFTLNGLLWPYRNDAIRYCIIQLHFQIFASVFVANSAT